MALLDKILKPGGKLGWTGVDATPDGLFGVSVLPPAEMGGKPVVAGCGLVEGAALDAESLPRLAEAIAAGGCSWVVPLDRKTYKILVIEEPAVRQDEMAQSVRWAISNMIDYPIADANVAWMKIPTAKLLPNRPPHIYAVAARSETVAAHIEAFKLVKLPLRAVDIQETAQRNIASLFETEERGVALAYFGEDWGLLTVTCRGELYLARRLDMGLRVLSGDAARQDGGALERVAVEIQRTLDHFERQFRSIPVARVLIAPTPEDFGLGEFLRSRLGIDSLQIDLKEVLAFEGEGPDAATQWRLFHHFGAALRHETRAL